MVLFQQCRFPAEKGTTRFVAYASRWGEKAWEPIAVQDPDKTRGYFTEALIDGLNGAAEETATRQVTAASLATYVAQAVEAKTKPPVAPYPQRAEMPVDLAVRLVLRDVLASEAPQPTAPQTGATSIHTATVHFPAGFTGEAAIRSSDGVERANWNAANGDWQVSLPDSFYQVVPRDGGAAAFAGNGLFALVGADADVRL
jgi:hypothetical protein